MSCGHRPRPVAVTPLFWLHTFLRKIIPCMLHIRFNHSPFTSWKYNRFLFAESSELGNSVEASIPEIFCYLTLQTSILRMDTSDCRVWTSSALADERTKLLYKMKFPWLYMPSNNKMRSVLPFWARWYSMYFVPSIHQYLFNIHDSC